VAGKNQHYLPRFAMRGFASRSSGSESYTWVFRKNRGPFESNLSNVASEGYFYGEPGDQTLDEQITRMESEHALTHEWLFGIVGVVSAPHLERIADLIYWMAIRSRNLRRMFQGILEEAATSVEESVNTPEKVVAFFLSRRRQMMREEIRKALKKSLGRKPNRNEVAKAEAWVAAQLPKQAETQSAELLELFRNMKGMLGPMTRNAHNKALSNVIDEKVVYLEKLRAFGWSVEERPSRLVLGDVGPFAISDQGLPKLAIEGIDETRSLFLPLSSSRLLAGHRGDGHADCARVNEISVRLSCEFFISCQNDQRERELQPHLAEEFDLQRSTAVKD
jgi:hypothetical protein